MGRSACGGGESPSRRKIKVNIKNSSALNIFLSFFFREMIVCANIAAEQVARERDRKITERRGTILWFFFLPKPSQELTTLHTNTLKYWQSVEPEKKKNSRLVRTYSFSWKKRRAFYAQSSSQMIRKQASQMKTWEREGESVTKCRLGSRRPFFRRHRAI